MAQKVWINLYRAGWFHRMGKPGNCDVHAGDCYLSEEQARADVEPKSHYLATVSFVWEGEPMQANPIDSVPTPLSVTRRIAVALNHQGA